MADHDPTPKALLRRQLLAARAAADPVQQGQERFELAARLLAVVGSGPRLVCAYVSTRGEPATDRVLAGLADAGHRVLLPVLLVDLDLDWATWEPGMQLARGRRGLHEPSGPRLGVDAVAGAEVVVCPGLAGTPSGARLGRGGGSYDRALSRTSAATLRVLLLHDREVRDEVPTDPHDQPVNVLVTPRRTIRCRSEPASG